MVNTNTIRIIAYRDFLVHEVLIRKGMTPYDDDTPDGAPVKKRPTDKGYKKAIFSINQYFMVPIEMPGMVYVRQHVKAECASWMPDLDYYEGSRTVEYDNDSYHRDMIRRGLKGRQPSYAIEIRKYKEGRLGDMVAYGFYTMGAWRGKTGGAIVRPQLPQDWDVSRLTKLIRIAIYNE